MSSKLSQVQKIVRFLQNNPNIGFTARDIASKIVALYPEDYQSKRQNPRFADEKAFLAQIVAEVGSQKEQILKANSHVFWKDKPRPRVYWYDPEMSHEQDVTELMSDKGTSLNEHQLYPLLIDYLHSELQLYCRRIDEKHSRNQRGSGGNKWLHPDIVAMQPLDKSWDDLVRICVQKSDGQNVRLWSFEVKKELNSSNVRESFFQAVSNSSWANEGYLVSTAISTHQIEQELRMLSALHGIGVILLNPDNPSESEILLPAKSRPQVDWQTVNRIVKENSDFKDFIELVSTYYQTGRLRNKDWNKVD